jgi:transcription termination/antitermination protein NusA
MRKFGPNVRFEMSMDELKGTMEIMRLRQVVETVEDPSCEISLEEARFEDPDFEVGDMLEEQVAFEDFGRLAVQAAKQRIIQRVREGERTKIREEFGDRVGELLSRRDPADRAGQDRPDPQQVPRGRGDHSVP